MAEQNKAMENNNQNQETQNQNPTQEQTQQPTGTPSLNPENMAKKQPELVSVPMDPRAAKALEVTKKVLKVALPLAAVGGAVFLGINLGQGNERKKSKAKEANYQAQVTDLQRQLAERPLPALPELTPPPAMDIPAPSSIDQTHGVF